MVYYDQLINLVSFLWQVLPDVLSFLLVIFGVCSYIKLLLLSSHNLINKIVLSDYILISNRSNNNHKVQKPLYLHYN